ncbi:MAG TPA: arginase [Chloroflexota bacterium]|nr:arginase [Chloroflexota bacterium]
MPAGRVEILGAPVDLGADRRGVDMGPSAIRYAGLRSGLEDSGHEVTDLGNLPLMLGDEVDPGSPRAKYLDEIVRMSRSIAEAVAPVMERGSLPLILGGDHSASLGSVSGAATGRQIGLIWIDAHGDFNTPETTPSGNVHGMILAALTGLGDERMVDLLGHGRAIAPEHTALVGVRELDPGERELLRSSGVNVFTMSDIDRLGMATVMSQAIEATNRPDGMHLSLDLDVVDPLEAPGVGTPVPGGLSYREAHLAMELAAASTRLVSMDVVEVNPILDSRNQTARMAVDFVLSALGKRIL